MPNVLLMANDPAEAVLLEVHLARSAPGAYTFVRARDLEAALRAIDHGRVDVALVDLATPGGPGPETLDALRSQAPDLPLVAVVDADADVARAASEHGATEVVTRRPGRPMLLARVLDHAVERRAHERALERERRARADAESRFEALFRTPSVGLAFARADGRIVEANEALAQLAARAREALAGMRLGELLAEDGPDDADVLARLAAGSLASHSAERQLRRPDGSLVWVLLMLDALPAAPGRPFRLLVRARDIGGFKQVESAMRASERRFRAVFENTPIGMCIVGLDGRLIASNEALQRTLGYGPEELIGATHGDLVHPEDTDIGRTERLALLAGERDHYRAQRRYRRKDGEIVHLQLHSSLVRDADGRPSFAIAIAEDVTDRVRAEHALRERTVRLLELVAAAANEASTIEEALQICVRHVCETLGWEVGHAFLAAFDGPHRVLLPTSVWFLADAERFGPFREATLSMRFALGQGLPGRVLASGKPVWITTFADDDEFLRAEHARSVGLRAAFCFPVRVGTEVAGVIEFFSTRALPVDTPVADAMAQIGVQLSNVIERKRMDARLAYHALHDPLTGLPNRVLFLDRLRQALQKLGRKEVQVALLFLDLDGFKEINDSAGHEIGDELLMAVAVRLRGLVRPGDTIARFGGDEFTVLCEEVAGEEEAVAIAERISDGMREPFRVGGADHEVTASIGIALGAGPTDAPEVLLRNADAAMYRAKARGGAGHDLFDEAMRARVLRRRGAEHALRRAIDRDQLRLLYQPSVSLRDGTICGVEALVRWQHPERGLIEAGEIIPVAEQSGLIVPLGAWVLEEACRQAARWRERLPEALQPRVWVNLSLRQLNAGSLPEAVAEALHRTGLDPRGLCFEITESAIMENAETGTNGLQMLRDLGIALCIDDFGTGYSSLASLKRLPVGQLKLDRTFVEGLGGNPRDSAIVAAVIDLAHALELQVIAEGVETRAQLDRLRALGCDGAQGYFFAHPLPADAVEALILERPTW